MRIRIIAVIFFLAVSGILIFFAFGQVNYSKAEGSVNSVRKTDNRDILNVPSQGIDNTYYIKLNINFPANNFYNFIYTLTEVNHDRACRFNRNLESKCNDDVAGGDDIVTDGEYIYIVDDSDDRLEKYQPGSSNDVGLSQVKSVGGVGSYDVAGKTISTDGDYLYIATPNEWICIWNKDLERAKFNNGRECDDWNYGLITISGDYIYTTSIDSDSRIVKIGARDPSVSEEKSLGVNLSPQNILVKFATDGNYLFARIMDTSNEQKLCKWDANTLALVKCENLPSQFLRNDFYFYPSLTIGQDDKDTYLYTVNHSYVDGQLHEWMSKFDLNLNFKEAKETGGGVNPTSMTSLGPIDIYDNYPVGSSFVSTDVSGGTNDPGSSTYKWLSWSSPTEWSGAKFKIHLSYEGALERYECNDSSASIINNIWAKVRNFSSQIRWQNQDGSSDSTTITCNPESKGVNVVVKWKEGTREEKVELKTILKDVH